MCGLVAYFSEAKKVDVEVFDQMRDALTSRGPDGAASTFFEDFKVALGHRRLAINDLSDAGTQPMCNEDGSVWLVFNGEIYNHPELALELTRAGHKYRSSSDSETIIHAWEQWGEECVLKFKGIFSFVIWDARQQVAYCARDHLGVKPLYYKFEEETLTIASQPKAILQSQAVNSPELEAFVDYLFYGVVPDEKSIFSGIKKLPPGHSLMYKAGQISVQRFWQPRYAPTIFDIDEATLLLTNALDKAVSRQLLSDVEYGAFLSGGIDSSLISAIAANHKPNLPLPTLSVGFKETKHSELEYSRLAAELIGADPHEHILTRAEAMVLITKAPAVFDEPYGLGAAIPLMCISEFSQRLGYKVMLAGDGADELFAGYRHYDAIDGVEDPLQHYKPHEAILADDESIPCLGEVAKEYLLDSPSWRYKKFSPSTENKVLNTQIVDLNSYLPDEILTKVDRASMACGVEARVPFLDQDLVELVLQIDHKLIYGGGERKALLKRAAKKWLPDQVLTQRKKGFSIPMRRWILRPDSWMKMYLEIRNGRLVQARLIDRKEFTRRGPFLSSSWMWKYYMLELWAQAWLD